MKLTEVYLTQWSALRGYTAATFCVTTSNDNLKEEEKKPNRAQISSKKHFKGSVKFLGRTL